MPGKRGDILTRLMAKVEKAEDGCWNFTGAHNGRGYGRIGRGPAGAGMAYAYRVTYEHFIEPIAEGLVIDHICRNPRCVNPDHLQPVTQRTNTLRGISPWAIRARRTRCIHGHEFTPENTYISKNGTRHCYTCSNARSAAIKRRKREAA